MTAHDDRYSCFGIEGRDKAERDLQQVERYHDVEFWMFAGVLESKGMNGPAAGFPSFGLFAMDYYFWMRMDTSSTSNPVPSVSFLALWTTGVEGVGVQALKRLHGSLRWLIVGERGSAMACSRKGFLTWKL